MVRIKLHVMNLEKRETCVLGRRPQDFERMLLLALGPEDGAAYTATEFIRSTLQGIEHQKLVALHAARLNNLANSADNPFVPDNQDEIDAERAKPKEERKNIPKRWTRQKWLTRISDQRYHELWLLDQWMKREALFGTIFYYDTVSGRVVTEVSAIPAPKPAAVSKPKNLPVHLPRIANKANLPVLTSKRIKPKKRMKTRLAWPLLVLVLALGGFFVFNDSGYEDSQSLYRNRFEAHSTSPHPWLRHSPRENLVKKSWQGVQDSKPTVTQATLGFLAY